MATNFRLSDDKTTLYASPCMPHTRMAGILQTVGGFHEFPQDGILTIPLDNATASSLRQALTGQDVSFAEGVGPFLGALADNRVKQSCADLFLAQNKKFAVLNTGTMPTNAYSAWMRFRLNDAENSYPEFGSGLFSVRLDLVSHVVENLKSISVAPSLMTDEVQLAMAPQAVAQKEEPTEPAVNVAFQKVELPTLTPFPSYDGTLLSLKSVKVTDYLCVREDAVKILEARQKQEGKKTKTGMAARKTLAEKLDSYGIETAYDLIHRFPLRHVDRSNPVLIRDMKVDEEVSMVGTILEIGNRAVGASKRQTMTTVKVADAAGGKISLSFFSQSYLPYIFFAGDEVIVNGKFERYNGYPQIKNPKMDKVGDARGQLPLIPVYPQSEKYQLKTWDFMVLLKETLARIDRIPLKEAISEEIRSAYRIPERKDAYLGIHFPADKQDFENAIRYLVYDELLHLQLYIQQQKRDAVARMGIRHDAPNTLVEDYISSLPYTLTGAQSRAIKEIESDMASQNPMHRLVQGDVGAGKTQVGNTTVLRAVQNGFQGAMMAPTEILAEQLHQGILEASEGLLNPRTGEPVRIRFLANKTKAKDAREIKAGLADGSVEIVVGTHSLLSESVEFHNLGVIVIDEQHRFGVEQRTKLRNIRKDGLTPDMLVMTATPIPRSSAMVLYGDLDITVLDELPPGRTPIKTFWIDANTEYAVTDDNLAPWKDIRQEVAAGHQAYIVASLVDDTAKNSSEEEKKAAQSVVDTYNQLSQGAFSDLKMAYVHGKQNRDEREQIMREFSQGNIDILVATTVIEVGVNVPNATVMVVLDPARFGIAQLHQIRGRVGRSSLPSRCYLVGEAKGDDAQFRIDALVESTDGFYLAEKDLELRGSGTVFGEKQSGQTDLNIAEINKHLKVLKVAKDDAERILASDPHLESPENRILGNEVYAMFAGKTIRS